MRSLEHLAYQLSRSALRQQESIINELRARAGALLTATAVVTSFLGGRALDLGDHRVLALCGFVLAVVAIVLAVYVLAPKRDLDFVLSGPGVHEYAAPTRSPTSWDLSSRDANGEWHDQEVTTLAAGSRRR